MLTSGVIDISQLSQEDVSLLAPVANASLPYKRTIIP